MFEIEKSPNPLILLALRALFVIGLTFLYMEKK
jgi:hypothetical protein